MVGDSLDPLTAAIWLLAQEKSQTVLQKMEPHMRAKVLAALAGFVILGFGLMALASIGARVTRRYMNQGPSRRRDLAQFEDDWATKPLVPPEKKLDADDETS
jgi:hypothetical protein